MTMQVTGFDIDAYARALEAWDVDALGEMYTEDTEFVKIDGEHPPSDPLVVRGRETLLGMFRHCKSIGVRSKIGHSIGGPQRAAATGTCVFPDGREVTFNHVDELRDGRIARQTEIAIIERSVSGP
jgi:ketosteroid isomerase-like protein